MMQALWLWVMIGLGSGLSSEALECPGAQARTSSGGIGVDADQGRARGEAFDAASLESREICSGLIEASCEARGCRWVPTSLRHQVHIRGNACIDSEQEWICHAQATARCSAECEPRSP